LGAFALGACADSDLPQEPVEDVPDAAQSNAVSKTIVTYDDHLAAIDVDGFAGLNGDDAGRTVVRSTRSDPDLSTYPTLRGGATLEVSVSPRVALTAATRVKLVLSEEEEPPVPPFDETWFLNLSVGGRISL
jgi:hypothetical protein